ncbi:microtubule organization protein AKNA isoform X2 [Clinocottus analis]|uniref:microtubule organization protein AKNA isoform X2 n=1 Tax=Clinocottus analis TaxID=304258 RepID=UPI0035C1E821
MSRRRDCCSSGSGDGSADPQEPFKREDKASMEAAAEESDEDARVEDKPTVFWEKCIQQSVFVDLSEDESLHLSDLETSLALRLSRAESAGSEASVHLSGSAELSPLDVTSSESSVVVSSQSEMVGESKPKSSILHVSAPKPNTVPDEPPLIKHEDPVDTSDEEQEDLPFDEDLGSPYFNQTVNSEGDTSSVGTETIHASPDCSGVPECKTRGRDDVIERLVSAERHAEKAATLSQDDGNTERDNSLDGSKPSGVAPSCPCPSDLDQLLLRHFSQEELLRPRRPIEAETLPEVSLLESGDDTVCSWAPTRNSSTSNSKHSDGAEMNQSFCSDRNDETSASGKKCHLEDEAEREIDTVTFSDSSRDKSAVDVEKQEKDEQLQRVPLVRTRSLSEMKYGQGQVHYPLPDFSKVAPKVKIPKCPNGPARPVPQSPSTMHRARSSPEMLGLIHRVLEDSAQPAVKPYVFKEEDKQSAPALVHHLQMEYDKLLTKYAEAEKRIDQMRAGTNAQASSDLMLYLECDDDLQGNVVERSHLGSVASHLPPSENLQSSNVNTSSPSRPEAGDGERMTAELMDIISQFMQKVDGFKSSVSIMSMSTAEQQMMLRSIMEAQDQLEREYIRKKEQHRALEMQNYLGLSRKTGVFDPNRQVEGDLFRIGMQLEDIKEMIDKNVCEQISPPHSTSTPTPMKEVELSPLYMPSPSPPPSLQEGPHAAFSTAGYEMETQKEEVEEERKVHRDESSELKTTEAVLKNTGQNYCYASSPAGQEVQTLEAEDERSCLSSEATDHSNILAYLSGSSASARLREWTCSSRSSPDSVLTPVGGCDLGDCVSQAVEVLLRDSDSHILSEPPLKTSSPSQRFVSPETDSGFGSSYLNQSASEPIQLNLLTESGLSQNDGLSGSDSEGSSNLQTAVQSASLSSQRWVRPSTSVQTQSGGAAVERWVESTTKEPSAKLQGSDRSRPAQLHHRVSEPELGTTMDSEERGNPLHSCSCNSETIVALQSEVSRLKKDLQQGLVQLPHLAQKMDDLTCKYKQDHQERKSKTRPRTHHRPACNSVWMPSSSTQNASNHSSGHTRRDDWTSSDMDPSRSRDSDATSGPEVMLQFHNSPVEGRRDGVHSAPELQSNRGSKRNGFKTSDLTGHVLKEGKTSDSHEKQRPQTAIMESFYSKESWSLFPSASLQKPLLQVGYGSSSSLPASYKVRETPLRPMSHQRKRSTQSDSALLPSNVFFQRTPSPASWPSKTGSRSGRCRGTKEVEMSRSLDQAIEVARCMKRTTDRMAKRLSADLAEAHLHRRAHSVQPPPGGSKPRYNKQSTDQFPL